MFKSNQRERGGGEVFFQDKNSDLSCGQIHQNIVQMSIPKPDDVANHGHDSGGSGVTLSDVPPLIGSCAGAPNLSAKGQNILRMHVLVLSLHILWHGLLFVFHM